MGLDMYLYSKISSVRFSGEPASETRQKLEAVAGELGLKDDAGRGNYGYLAIEQQAGYWRKANAIHNWFVTEVQGGVDECQLSYVSIGQLEALRELCEKVVATAVMVDTGKTVSVLHVGGPDGPKRVNEPVMDVANPEEVAALLPPTSGFFFGSTDVDEWFIDDVKHTIEVVKHCQDLHRAHDYNVEFHYRSSW